MATLYSTAQAADTLGVDKSTITRLAKRLEVGQLVGMSLVFTEAEVEALRGAKRDGPGNPQFVEGNTLGQRRKKITAKAAKKRVRKKSQK